MGPEYAATEGDQGRAVSPHSSSDLAADVTSHHAVKKVADRPFHVLVKPTGPLCNLDCSYCYYLEKEHLYPSTVTWRMPEPVLERFIAEYISAQPVPTVTFSWQGGEPTLLGLDFFRKVVALQQKYADGKRIENTFQTNGVRLNEEWCTFFKEHNFLVGISIDGPEDLHNVYRVDKGRKPTFRKVNAAIEKLRAHGVPFNTLTVVHRKNAKEPLRVYEFLKQIGSTHMQFIPLVERVAEAPTAEGLRLVPPEYSAKSHVTEWSVQPEDYGYFLVTVFDRWVRSDVGKIFVQQFEVTLEAWVGLPPSLCVFRETCGDALVLEHNGDVYACDHFVYPQYRLGNVMENALLECVQSAQQRSFGIAKRETLPKYCRQCEFCFVCRGECPKHRFCLTPDGEPGLNYLCGAYKRFFTHVAPYMDFITREIIQGRPAASVMQMASVATNPHTEPKIPPNAPCPCGSGRKYKRCCGRV